MSRSSDRNQSIERLLEQSLHAGASPASPESCVDAEMLAAWSEGSLSGRQLSMVEAHLADCSRCQAMLADLVRTTPAPVAPESWWRRSLGARWLIPVAATATALAIWVAVPRDELSRPPEQVTASKEERQASPAAVDQVAVPGQTAQAEPVASPTPRAADAEGRRDAPAAALGRATTADSTQVQITGETPSAAASPPAARVEAAAQDSSAPPAPAAGAQSARARLNETMALASPAEIASPNAPSRWRIGAAGTVQYSADGGTTWEATQSGVTVDLTAGTSPSGTVAWLVGRAGTVVRTTDGRTWQRLAFPLTMDLVAVKAADARTATVTTVSGRSLSTTDAGLTWR